ncbi:MAG: hypothetical protein ACD_58C00322G0001 [uncultured bacterium]|nr:MAG: hypothetical protein ACD_58C00322G0001 [uncultured bacterium]
MPKMPIISGDKAVSAFSKLGYQVVRQKGSHIRMRHFCDKSKGPITIPRHSSLGKGLLRSLFRDADITSDEFIKLL